MSTRNDGAAALRGELQGSHGAYQSAAVDDVKLAADAEVPAGDPSEILGALRAKLDRIDDELLDVLRQRLALCCAIGMHKRDHAIAMMQPQRIGVVQSRAAAYASLHGMSHAFLRSLYELIIAETCRLENEIIERPWKRSGW